MSGIDQSDLSLDVLLTRVGSADRHAFDELYRRTSAKLFGACLRILSDRQEAEDALQTVYLSVWRNAVRFDAKRGAPMTWLMTLARNGAVDRLRATKTIASMPIEAADEVPDPALLPSELADAADDTHRLHRCIGRLDPLDTKYVRAAFFEGSTYAELAQRSGSPLGTIKSRIRRALLKLRDCLA